MSMVHELRNKISNNKVTIQEIVRKAYVMSKLLKLDYVTKWLDCEMNGYDQNTDVPNYRKLSGKLEAYQYPNRLIIYEIEHPIGHNDYILRDSIHLLEAYISKEEYKNTLQVTNEYTKNCSKDWYLSIEKSYISEVLKQIEDQVLRLTLELENQGILGDKMTFTDKEKSKAKAIPQIINNIINNYGNNSNIQAGGTDNTIKSNNDFTIEKQGE